MGHRSVVSSLLSNSIHPHVFHLRSAAQTDTRPIHTVWVAELPLLCVAAAAVLLLPALFFYMEFDFDYC